MEEVATKYEEPDVGVELPEDTVTMELLLKIMDCVVPYATIVEEHRGICGNIISRLYNGDFAVLI